MMNFYEELGVSDGASREEIRRAYKRLAKLFHPDRCVDPAGRVMAELQMRRLNQILALLNDPEQRASYDRRLLTAGTWEETGETDRQLGRAAGCANSARHWMARLGAHGAFRFSLEWWHEAPWRQRAGRSAAVLAAMSLLMTWALTPSQPAVQPPVALPAEIPAPAAAPRAHRRARIPAPPSRAEEVVDASGMPVRYTAPVAGLPPALTPGLREATHAPIIGEIASSRPARPGSGEVVSDGNSHRLSGDWFFVPTPETTRSGYAPEYIELRLSETGGVTRGRYRARYRVADRAISPTVAFEFEGRTDGDDGVLPWQGPGGARGEVSFRLLPNGNLEVAWSAGRLGEELGLISGMATLVRKLE